MALHETADFTHLGPGPIDIEAAAAVLEAARFTPDEDLEIKSDAQAELGGIAHIAADERRLYLPYVNVLRDDPRKEDIRRGLGGLGLLVVAPEDVRRFGGNGQRVHPRQLDFAAAALNYGKLLHSKVHTLPVPGQIEGLQDMYPDTDEAWMHEYVPQLEGLRAAFTSSAVFHAAEQVKKRNHHAVQARMNALPHPHIVEVHLDKHGKPVVVKNARNKNHSYAA